MWRTVERDGKPTKVPLTTNGRPASSTDPETWGTYEACERVLRNGRYDGIGYVFAEDDEYFGVDLDHCVTDGVVHAAAMEIVRRLNSYTEFSPSGTGLHTIGRGAVNGRRNRTKKTPWGHDFEVYDRARFFTVTGRQLFGAPATIEARQQELEAVCAEMFPAPVKTNGHAMLTPTAPVADDVALEEKIRSSKQGSRFADLFDRGAPEGQESESDLGLCNILAFWLGPDETRIDAWFRRSALMRDKWDSPRGETTYGGYTIDRALEGRTEYYGQKRNGAAPARPKDDNTEMSYSEEISTLFGIIDDPIVSGWRSSRKANCRVVFTTKSGAELDLDNWKAATSTPKTLSQEIGIQLGVEVTLKADHIRRLDVLVGRYCNLYETMTVRDRAHDLGIAFLQEAEEIEVDIANQKSRWDAFLVMKERHPMAHSRTENVSLSRASIVLKDITGKRYVRVQWFIDYVKACAVAGTAVTILEHIEAPGGWNRIANAKSQMKATDPQTKREIWQVLYEVPADWLDKQEGR